MANDIKWGRRGKPKIDSSTNNYPVRFATQPGYRKGERFLADDYSNSFDHRLRNINKPKRNLTLASQLQVVSNLDEVLLPVLTLSPEQAWRLWSHVKRAILNNMISEYEVMLASQEDASSWKTFISRHTELIHEVLKDPFCGICKSSRKRDTNSSDEGIIIASESALVLIIKSPDTPLVTKISMGAATTSWVASAQIQSAVNETLEFSRTFNGGKTRYVVIAGTLPKNKAPLTALEGYKRTVSQIQIVDFTALLEGLRRLTSKTGKPA